MSVPLAERRRLTLGHIAIPILRSEDDIAPIVPPERFTEQSTLRTKLALVGLTLCLLAGAYVQGLPSAVPEMRRNPALSAGVLGDPTTG